MNNCDMDEKKQFYEKLNSWYKKAMALDPQAYKNEPTPSRLPKHMDTAPAFLPSSGKIISIPQPQNQEEIDALYSGVHFAFDAEHAGIYACSKATANDPPVIIEIDPQDLKQQADVDAIMDQSLTSYLEEKRNEWKNILKARKNKEQIAWDLYNDVDGDLNNWTEEGDINDDAADVLMQNQRVIPPGVILDMIRNNQEMKDPKQVIAIFKDLISGNISEQTMIKMVGQMRVNNNIDSSRVKAIYQIPWIDFSAETIPELWNAPDEILEEKGWHRDGEDVKNENGQIIPSYDDIVYNQWLSLKPLYINKQTSFPGYSSEESVWHGTTLSRAKQAYPELLTNAEVGNIEAKTKSWYKSPFMRSMDYVK